MESTHKANQPKLAPENQFPAQAVSESVISKPPVNQSAQWNSGFFTMRVATAADFIEQWGKNVKRRDQQLRDFWPTESYLAGAVTSVSFRNATSDWVIKHPSKSVSEAVTNMLNSAIAGDTFGWNPFIQRFSQDLYCQDNGAFIELIRDPGIDANSKFKGAMAPVIGIANLDSNQCQRTGNIEYPVLYADRDSVVHKLAWYEVIPFSEYPSSIEKMNGVGYCAVTRALRLAQIIRSVLLFKDEEVSGTNVKKINIVGGVGRTQIDDAVKRTLENAANRGNAKYVEHAVLASLDPEKPVSVATVDLAGLPQDFDFDAEMQWYIAGLALDFGVDYQEFAPLPGGNIGSGSQSNMLARKASGKGPRNWMDSLSNAFMYYGVIPRGAELIFNDKNEEEEMEKQAVRTKAMEEAAIAVNAKILTPEAAMKSLVRRGIYLQEDIENIPAEWWEIALETAKNESKKQPVGDRGGNTTGEDAKRQNTGKPNTTGGDRLRKEADEFSFFEKVASLFKREKPDNLNVTVHNHPGKPANVLVKSAPIIKQPNVTVNVPRQPAPVVNIKQAAAPSPNVTVNVPEQKAQQTPHVTVNVPQQPPPHVTVNNPITVVGPKGPAEVEITYDKSGNPSGLKAKG